MRSVSLRGLEAEARERLDHAVYDFFAGAAEDETTMRANEAAYARIGLVPRVLRGCGAPELGVSLLGRRLETPVLVAPTAFHRLAHPDGECATARACAAAGTVMIAAMASTVPIAEIVAAGRERAPDSPAPWFQLYIQPDLDFTGAIVGRAEAAGCGALVLSADSPALGHRERDLRNAFRDLPDGLRCENMRAPGPGAVQARPRSFQFSPELSWAHMDWLRERTSLPILVKGVAHPDDARLAIEHGASGVIVSNHGGRQLDGVPASVELLPAIAKAIGDKVPVLLDGGIRRGSDVVKAFALGASAVAIGRPVLWGLAVDGEAGVKQVLEMLRDEIARVLTLCGSASLRGVGRELVRMPARDTSEATC
jgi:4-hydroxymandelate oxidase